MADSNRSREEGLVFLLYNYVLSRGIVLVLNGKCACVTIKPFNPMAGVILEYQIFADSSCITKQAYIKSFVTWELRDSSSKSL